MDESAELAAALGECQNLQIAAESRAVAAENLVKELRLAIIDRDTRITALEKANMDMDTCFQEFRVSYNPSPAAVDRG